MVGSGLIMEKTGDKSAKINQQTDMYNYTSDHMYCSDNSRYRNAGTHLNLAAAASDLKSLRKENKQLQAMLLLHLDLIQEQSNQIIAKDKQLVQLREENAQLRLKCERNAANERRQNNNRYTGPSGGKVLNTSGGSPTIDTYFTTADSKVSIRATHDSVSKIKTQNIITNQNMVMNMNVTNENQMSNEIHSTQTTTVPVKIEMNTIFDESKPRINAHGDIIHEKDRLYKTNNAPTSVALPLPPPPPQPTISINNAVLNDKPIPVKYRTIENNIIGHNNGKLISKIILQRKKSENGEKIFVRTKNIDIGNNRANYEKWSSLRPINNKTDTVNHPTTEKEALVLESTSPTSNTAAINDESVSSNVTDEQNYLMSSAGMSPPPSVQTTMDHSDLSGDFQIENIKIEEDIEAHDGTRTDEDASVEAVPEVGGDDDYNGNDIDDDDDDDDDEEDDDDDDDNDDYDENIHDLPPTLPSLPLPESSPIHQHRDDSTIEDDSQDMTNIESPRTSESTPNLPMPSSPITSIVSASDYNQCDLFSATHFSDSNSTTNFAGSTTIVYPMSKRQIARSAILTTKKPYKIREWQLDEIEMELKQEITDEICKEENDSNLELPKWRTWELSSNRDVPVPREYEDLSDDAFARRHARFLMDERKRKKWDVQRIREQRTIERLKRRHCKDELNQQNQFNEIFTFFPTVDQLKTIQITDDLPVCAFGESIPLLSPSEFSLPWHLNQNASSSRCDVSLEKSEQQPFGGLSLALDSQQSVSNCLNTSIEPAPSNVSTIIFLPKKRAGRTRTSISHAAPHINSKCST